MALSISLATICLIACHGGPADHFATYAESLIKQGHTVQIYAMEGPALKKFQERSIKVIPFSLKDLTSEGEDDLANEIAKTCSVASIAITDVGHEFDRRVQQALATHATNVTRFAYYDNPESFVPGGYSATATKVMLNAEGVLFANANLTKETIYSEKGKEIDFGNIKRCGIGYYPLEQAQKIAERRETEHEELRSKFFNQNKIEDKGQKLLVYFGGNNEEYFSKAFPAFLSFLQQSSTVLKDAVVVIQQHPGAIAENRDGAQIGEELSKNVQILISSFSTEDAQVMADAAFYYQTSMAPQFALEELPTIQVGHETYEDLLVKNSLIPSVVNAEQFSGIINNWEKVLNDKPQKEVVLQALGFREDWSDVLAETIKKAASKE